MKRMWQGGAPRKLLSERAYAMRALVASAVLVAIAFYLWLKR